MVGEDALQNGAQIRGRREVAALIELVRLQARPIGDDASARDRAAGEEGRGSRPVIGAIGAVYARGAAEFGDRDNGRVLPMLAKALFELLEGAVDPDRPEFAN